MLGLCAVQNLAIVAEIAPFCLKIKGMVREKYLAKARGYSLL